MKNFSMSKLKKKASKFLEINFNLQKRNKKEKMNGQMYINYKKVKQVI